MEKIDMDQINSFKISRTMTYRSAGQCSNP